MGNPEPDEIDAWLSVPVEPLRPPAGALGRIRRTARRRKAAKLVTAAAGAVIVIAAAALVPVAVSGLRSAPGTAARQAAAQGGSPGSAQVVGGRRSPGPRRQGSGSKTAVRAARLSATGSATPPPQNFQPTSVTFISPFIGAVIGQAGTPGHCATRYCTSLAGTADYGATWYGINAPVTGAPDGSSGVSQVRFTGLHEGWAFGPALWVTHDGGATWAAQQTSGHRVLTLEAAAGRAFAVFATCTGSGPAYAAGCTSFSLYSSPAGTSRWRLVPGPSASLAAPAAGLPGQPGLVLTASRGYLLTPSGALLTGPLTGAAWAPAGAPLPCGPSAPPQPSAAPSASPPAQGAASPPGGRPAVLLAAASSAQLALACASPAPGGGSQLTSVYVSADSGATWTAAPGSPPAAQAVTALAAQPGGLLLLATDTGIDRSADGGATWQQVLASPAGQDGFSYAGMTSGRNGVALPADPGLHEIFTTSDGGATWQRRPVSAP